MAVKISALPAANGIDAVNDYLPIVQSTVTNKINRNTFLGITGSPIGSSDSQSLSNKTIGNTNSITVLDGSLTIQNTADATKQAVFSLSGITTGNTRTLTVPDSSGTLVTTSGTQTLTNKTLTSPTITGGTIDNTTITVDSVSGHSTSTLVTVANLQISNGVLNSANAVTSTSIAAGAVQPQALVTGTGSGWSLQSWTPTYTNLTVGNGVHTSSYIQVGKLIIARLGFKFGTTSAMGTSPTFTLPVTSVTAYTDGHYLGAVRLVAAGSPYFGYIQWATTTTAHILASGAAGSYVNDAGITSGIPNTWATNDQIQGTIIYEVP